MAELKRCGIYSITCTKTQGCYVGQTARVFEERWREHKADLERDHHKNKSLQSIANRYKVQSLKFKILEQCDVNQLDDREIFWIAKQGTWNADPSQAEANRRLVGGKAKKKSRSKSKSKTGAGWYWWLWVWILLGAIAFLVTGWNPFVGAFIGGAGYVLKS